MVWKPLLRREGELHQIGEPLGFYAVVIHESW